MSGGSYNYEYSRIEELAIDIKPTSPLRKAFKNHLLLISKACKAIEWVDSGDSSDGDEDKAIQACLEGRVESLVLQEMIEEAKHSHEELGKAIAAACALNEP